MATTRRNKRQREADSEVKATAGGVCKMAAGRKDCCGKWGGETVYSAKKRRIKIRIVFVGVILLLHTY
jgi:hypothetical protein